MVMVEIGWKLITESVSSSRRDCSKLFSHVGGQRARDAKARRAMGSSSHIALVAVSQTSFAFLAVNLFVFSFHPSPHRLGFFHKFRFIPSHCAFKSHFRT